MEDLNNYINDNSALALTSNNELCLKDNLGKKRKTLWDENRVENTFYGVKTTKWGKPYEKTFTPIPFSYFPKDISLDNIEIVLRRSRLDDLNKRLANNNFEALDNDIRSPSPEPVYDLKTHVRLNTFEIRQKEEYIKEKNNIIEELIKLDKEYKPPSDWKPPKKSIKLYYNNKPECNITALLLGPKGITHRELEKKTGCKLSIRDKDNKASVNYDNAQIEDSPYVLLQAKNTEILNKGASIIKPILNTHSQEHFHFRNLQKQLVNKQFGLEANDKDMGCENCGEKGHYTWACPMTIEANMSALECALCNEKGHLTIDCKSFLNGGQADPKQAEFDEFMKKVNTEDVNTMQSGMQNSVLMRGNLPVNNFPPYGMNINYLQSNFMNPLKNIPLINVNGLSNVNSVNSFNPIVNDNDIVKRTLQTNSSNHNIGNLENNFLNNFNNTNNNIIHLNENQKSTDETNNINSSNSLNEKSHENNENNGKVVLNTIQNESNIKNNQLELNENKENLVGTNQINQSNNNNNLPFSQPVIPNNIPNMPNMPYNYQLNPSIMNPMNPINMINYGMYNPMFKNNMMGNVDPYSNMNQNTAIYKNAPVFVPPPDYYLKLKKLNEMKEKK